MGEGWRREVEEKREELKEKEGGSVVADLNEDFPDQSPRKRISRGVSYHR